MCKKNLHDYNRVFISDSFRFATGKRVNHGGEYREIPANIYLYGPEKFIKLAKK